MTLAAIREAQVRLAQTIGEAAQQLEIERHRTGFEQGQAEERDRIILLLAHRRDQLPASEHTRRDELTRVMALLRP